MRWLALLLIIVYGCGEEPIQPPIVNELCDPEDKVCYYKPTVIHLAGEMKFGHVQGLKNCQPFEASSEAYQENGNPNIGVVLRTYEQLSFLADKELLFIQAKTNENPIGRWPLLKDTIQNLSYHVYNIYEDHDQLQDIYHIDNNYEYNFVEICKIDSMDKKVYGMFEVRFINSQLNSHSTNPDTILFSNCVFEAWHPE